MRRVRKSKYYLNVRLHKRLFMGDLELKEVINHPFVQELMEQNEQLLNSVPSQQTLALKPKINLGKITVPHLIKDRLLFQEGVHNDLFYSFDDIKEHQELWDNCDLFMAEHDDGSDKWVGLSKNIRVVPEEKALYGDLEIVDLSTAQKLEYQILNKNGRMGVSPTLDVDKKVGENGQELAGPPWDLKSQSIVLQPAVRTTVFNSKKNNNNRGGATMPEKQDLKKDEVSIKKEELEALKENQKQYNELMKVKLAADVEKLAQLEVDIGIATGENLSSRKESLMKMTNGERKVLSEMLSKIENELSDDSPEDRFMKSLSEEMRGKIPPELRKFIEEKKKGKKEEDMAKKKGEIQQEEEEEEDLAHQDKEGKKKDKQYPYPEKMNTETQKLSRQSNNLVLARPTEVNRFQNLSDEARKSNEEFLDFLTIQQGDTPDGGRK